jgi:hypothetical protein
MIKLRSLNNPKIFKTFIHLNFITGFFYAFYFYITSPKATHMYNRRLWAMESWFIATLYLIFIFLFFLEKSAEENIKGLKRFSKIKAQTTIYTTKKDLIKFFYKVSKNKKAYQFSSHQGIEILKGNLTKIGSTFRTREKFFIFFLEINFIITKVNPRQSFHFLITNPLPMLNIKGDFSFKKIGQEEINLSLSIYRNKINKAQYFISGFILNLLRPLIYKQIKKEVLFIQKQLES